jgi:hypothetical protein
MAKRSLHNVTKGHYRSMSCFGMVSRTNGPRLQCYGFPHKRPLLHHVVQAIHKVWRKVCHKVWWHSHSTEQDRQPIAVLISKQVIPYRTRGGTYCPGGGATPKIQSLADSSTICHDGINHLHHSNHCSNHSIDPHMINSHLDGWKTTLSQRRKPTQYHKGWKTCTTLMTAWLSITNQV